MMTAERFRLAFRCWFATGSEREERQRLPVRGTIPNPQSSRDRFRPPITKGSFSRNSVARATQHIQVLTLVSPQHHGNRKEQE